MVPAMALPLSLPLLMTSEVTPATGEPLTGPLWAVDWVPKEIFADDDTFRIVFIGPDPRSDTPLCIVSVALMLQVAEPNST